MTDTLPVFDSSDGLFPKEPTEEEIYQQNITKMFNICERPLMLYIADYLNKPVKEIFVADNILPDTVEPIVYFPIKEYKDDVYLSFSLEKVAADYSNGLADSPLMKLDIIKEGIDYIHGAVLEIFRVLTENCMESSSGIAQESIHLVFDQKSGTFRPVFIYPERRRFLNITSLLQMLEDFKKADANGHSKFDEMSATEKDTYDHQISQLYILVNQIDFNVDDANALEESRNKALVTVDRLGIVMRELSLEELPQLYRDKLALRNKKN
jgi:hypothetical protein